MKTDVLISGGGLSGLALADQLTQQGRDVLLVEAQNRLGGRILTQDLSGGQFDLGPAWTWPNHHRMAAIARRFAIPTFAQYATGDLIYQDQTGAIQRARGYAPMQGALRLAGGMRRLVDALRTALNPDRILPETRLECVEYGPRGIVAHLTRPDGPLRLAANQLVLAMPPRVIAETIAFDPPLASAHRQALETIPTWMAGQAKLIAVYPKPHWREAGLSGDAISHRGPLVEVHDASPERNGPYALFGFVGTSAQARATHAGTLRTLALAQLTELFGDAMAHPSDLVLQDWATVPEIARSQDSRPLRHHPVYGLPASLRALSVNGIHFGSTETAPNHGGFLEGALEAAERVAKHLSKSAGQPPVTNARSASSHPG